MTVKIEFPCVVSIEPTSRCNLRCPLCYSGRGNAAGKADMPLKHYTRLIEEIGKLSSNISLVNYGEPFLHPHIFKMIRLAKDEGLRVSTASNFNLSMNCIRMIPTSGLDILTISLDGVTPESYRKYRIGGDFNVVIRNTKLLLESRRLRGTLKPTVVLQFIIMSHNQHEIKQFVALGKALGVDRLRFKTLNSRGMAVASKLMPEKQYCRKPQRKTKSITSVNCAWPQKSLVVNCDGTVVPCCNVGHDSKMVLGNAFSDSLAEIWRSENYQRFRKAFHLQLNLPHQCQECQSSWLEDPRRQAESINERLLREYSWEVNREDDLHFFNEKMRTILDE